MIDLTRIISYQRSITNKEFMSNQTFNLNMITSLTYIFWCLNEEVYGIVVLALFSTRFLKKKKKKKKKIRITAIRTPSDLQKVSSRSIKGMPL